MITWTLLVMNSVYPIFKGVDQPIAFKGLQGQYIWWMIGGLLALFILFALLYIVGVKMGICLLIVFGLGTGFFFYVSYMSKQYGEYGLMKKLAHKYIPEIVKAR